MNDIELSESSNERDLGVVFNTDGKVYEQCSRAAFKASRALAQMRRNFISRDKYVLTRAYRSHVRPHLESAIQAWCPSYQKDIKLLEAVQQRFVRMVHGLRAKDYLGKLRELFESFIFLIFNSENLALQLLKLEEEEETA